MKPLLLAGALLSTLICTEKAVGGWQLVPEKSTLSFQATYDDAPVDGHFKSFTVAVKFDPEALTLDLDVDIDVTSVDTQNSERDQALAEGDWFAFEQHPQANYRAQAVTLDADGRFCAEGTLRLKGIEQAVPIKFTWNEENSEAQLIGTATMVGDTELNRLDFKVGDGDWVDPVIGHIVQIKFDLRLTK